MGKTIGIVTLTGNFNYGNRLQNYAVCKIYEALGFETETLSFSGRSVTSSLRHAVANLVLPHIATHPEESMNAARREAFLKFSEAIPTRKIDIPLSKVASQFDYFSVGSDQVWNPAFIDYYPWSYLSFADPEQRIALAPSIGVSHIRSPYARRMTSSGIMGFKHLSVREEAGAALVKSLTGKTAEVIIDPTMMLARETWESIASPRLIPDHPYVLAYLLGERTEEQENYLSFLQNHYCSDVVKLSDKAQVNEVDAGPAEFVSLIQHARHVVTDSFHATVFSLLFGTPFTILNRQGRAKVFSRLSTLSNKFCLGKFVFGDREFDSRRIEVAAPVDEYLNKERLLFCRFLSKALSETDVSIISRGV